MATNILHRSPQDEPPAEWLDPASPFHRAECFCLPPHSAVIDEVLFWYQIDSTWDDRIEGDPGCPGTVSLLWFEALDDARCIQLTVVNYETSIRRVYFNGGYTPPAVHDRAQYIAAGMEHAARFNFGRLAAGKIRPEHAAEAVEEIEHQLAQILPSRVTGERKAIVRQFEAWKQEHGF